MNTQDNKLDDFDLNEWGNTSDDILDPKWKYKQSTAQREANKQRNIDRWQNVNDEFRLQHGLKSKENMQNFWQSMSEKEKQSLAQKIKQERWDKLDKKTKAKQIANFKKMSTDPAIMKKMQETKLKNGTNILSSEMRLEVYNKTLSVERFGKKLYNKLAKEYNISKVYLHEIANNYRNLVNADIHQQNIDNLKLEYQQLKNVKKEKQRKKTEVYKAYGNSYRQQFTWRLISPGYDSAELYDYYNSLRTANQKMPIPPSVVYYVRQQKMSPKQIKQYCMDNNIYESDDYTYWCKLAKHNYHWFNLEKSKIYDFKNVNELITFCKTKFTSNLSLATAHAKAESGLMKSGAMAGWILQKIPIDFNK